MRIIESIGCFAKYVVFCLLNHEAQGGRHVAHRRGGWRAARCAPAGSAARAWAPCDPARGRHGDWYLVPRCVGTAARCEGPGWRTACGTAARAWRTADAARYELAAGRRAT